jgi:hypothetical protein
VVGVQTVASVGLASARVPVPGMLPAASGL